jgi:hypothetical protein
MMPKIVLGLAMAALLLGCNPTKQPASEPESSQPPAAEGGNVGIVSPAAGGLSPVTGGESIEGNAGGVGSALKGKAKDIAGSSPSSLNQMGGDE